MQYRSQFHVRRRSPRVTMTVLVTGLVVIAIGGLFALGIWWFRFRIKPTADVPVTNTIANVMSPTSVSAADLASTAAGTAREAVLRDVSGGSSTGTATRATADGQFSVALKASLPEIDREKELYEAWLVRQVPYDFFSLGEIVTNDDDEWVLEWQATSLASNVAGKFDGYTRVVVTREAKDGNPDPSGHVLRGEFK